MKRDGRRSSWFVVVRVHENWLSGPDAGAFRVKVYRRTWRVVPYGKRSVRYRVLEEGAAATVTGWGEVFGVLNQLREQRGEPGRLFVVGIGRVPSRKCFERG